MRRVLFRLAIAGVGLVVALALVEVLLRVFSDQLPPMVAAKAGITTTSNIGVERFRRAWLGSLVADDERGMRTAGGLDVQLDGHPDFSFRLRTDEHGFRNRYPDGPVDVVTIGDSFTFGYGVDENETWPALLENEIGRLVANLGQTNYGPQAELQVLNDEGLRLQPELVIWQFFANDFLDASMYQQWQEAGRPDYFQWEDQLLAEWREDNLTGEVLAGDVRGFLQRNLVSYELVKYVLGLGSYSVTRDQQVPVQVGNARLYLSRAHLDAWSNTDWPAIVGGRELTQATLLRARQQAEATGASFMVILIPSKEEVYAGWMGATASETPWTKTRNSQLMMAFCERNHITCLDLFDVIEQAARGGVVAYFPHDGHLNEDGQRILAGALAEYLTADFEWR